MKPNPAPTALHWRSLLPYLLVGIAFGIIAVKSEIVSWYRIQEMFRFQSFHMYGVIGSAVLTAFLSLQLLRATGTKARNGEHITLHAKAPTYTRYIAGGCCFGIGWGLVGACPGPIFALIGAGYGGYIVVLLGALLGTWLYGWLAPRLPH